MMQKNPFLDTASRPIYFLWALASLLFIAWSTLQYLNAAYALGSLSLSPANPGVITFIVPLSMALLFWGVGILAWRLQEVGIGYFLAFGALLAAGVLSSINNAWGMWFALFQVWIAPLFLQMHLQLVAPTTTSITRWLPRIFYIAALPLLAPLIVSQSQWEGQAWFPLWRVALRLNLVIAILLTIALVAYYYFRNTNALQRRRVRILLYGTLLAFAPMIMLAFLPEILGSPYRLDARWTLPFLVLNPLTYAYVIGLQHQQIRYEILFQRLASYYLAVTFSVGLFFIGLSLLRRMMPSEIISESLLLLFIAIILLVLFGPLLRACHTLIQRIWYGQEMTSQKMIAWIADSLAQSMDWNSLVILVTTNLIDAMRLQHSVFYAEQDETGFILMGAGGTRADTRLPSLLPSESPLLTYLQQVGEPVPHEALRLALENNKMGSAENALFTQFAPAYWLPLISKDEIRGVLLLGPRLGDDWISVDDLAVLQILMNQGGVAIHNVRLMEAVQQGRAQLAHAHQRLLKARESERKYLARELHDDAVQQLLGIGYQVQLAQRRVQNPDKSLPPTEIVSLLGDVNTNVVDVARALRLLVKELRPTGMEHIGLVTTLRAYISTLQTQYSDITITLDDGDIGLLYLPEDIIIAAFRVVQEALRNALRHASPTIISITIRHSNSHLILTVGDNGLGFVISPLSALTEENHFGLAGMHERVQLAGGTVEVHSQLHQGTTIIATLPTKEEYYESYH